MAHPNAMTSEIKNYDVQWIPTSKLHPLPGNPRKCEGAELERLVDSIRVNGFWKHRPLAVSDKAGTYTVLAGNQRLRVALRLGIKTLPCVVYSGLTPDEEKDIILRDNVNNGAWDFDKLLDEDLFSDVDFDFIGIDIPKEKPERSTSGKKKKEAEEDSIQEENDEGGGEKESFYRSMYKDVLYESDNAFDIPTLRLDGQAGKVELPLSPWGANSRLRKDVATYHFYVDDYRFEALFKDPIKLLMSNCKAVVEPNCSLHDQTPIAWGLQLIYKKRWLSRYLQECGIKVYADLNVSHKFVEYNKMGIPKGYNAFFTRGLDGWMESLKLDLQTAQEISGLEHPNLVVYGGGGEIQAFCREYNLLYITDFINAKKK